MASTFQTYLQLGFFHIFNLQAYDHLVFLLALCAPYVLQDWRRVVALVTSFTLGHSPHPGPGHAERGAVLAPGY
ncbi:HupE/UreJ family protein [Hymenobacter sp. J193]|uniref:HupE/UreJ family protein n=1 Tax=Hymenobacter sp. J193 TaxID=2898429 RepID=UPI0027E22144|nr:HupE/UreJ family protein [Hymenobacter sp. J193]